MKALLVVEDDAFADILRFYLQPLGLDIIHYKDPLKALDNLDEILPDAVIMSAKDYPRHWKSIVVNVRSTRPKSACVIILLKGEFFPFEEAAKAAYLGVNGVVKEDLSDKTELDHLHQLLKRYIELDESRTNDRHIPGPWDKLGFIFSHPYTYRPIVGTIETISSDGLSFAPDIGALVTDTEPGIVIDEASLRIDKDILDMRCRLMRNESVMAFVFDCSQQTRDSIAAYIAGRAERRYDLC
ncbi:hypothetical protein MASR2M48_26970 [Spirochaetota bacterium]